MLAVAEKSSDETLNENISLHGESSEYEEDFDEDIARKEPEGGDFVFI